METVLSFRISLRKQVKIFSLVAIQSQTKINHDRLLDQKLKFLVDLG